MLEGVLTLGDTEVERSSVIRDARLAWQAHGTLNAAKDNVIVYRAATPLWRHHAAPLHPAHRRRPNGDTVQFTP